MVDCMAFTSAKSLVAPRFHCTSVEMADVMAHTTRIASMVLKFHCVTVAT